MTLSYLWAKLCLRLRGKAIANSSLHPTVVINAGSQVVNTTIGKYSYCGYDCRLLNCEIGNYCSIADNVTIGSAQHPMAWVSTSPVFENVIHSGPTKRFSKFDVPEAPKTYIGSDVWIGHGVIIKAGVKIGHGAVVGAGTVVTKDVEPYTIVAGCPAKIIRKRFSVQIIKRLLNSQWWELDDERLQNVAYAIREPEEFLKLIENNLQ